MEGGGGGGGWLVGREWSGGVKHGVDGRHSSWASFS